MFPVNFPIGQMDTWSLILTVAIITGSSHPLSSYKIGLTKCYLLDLSLTFITSLDIIWFGWIHDLTAPSSPTLLSDPIRLPQAIYCLILLCLAFWPWCQGHLLRVWALDDINPLQSLCSEGLSGGVALLPKYLSPSLPCHILSYEQSIFCFKSSAIQTYSAENYWLTTPFPSNRFLPLSPFYTDILNIDFFCCS